MDEGENLGKCENRRSPTPEQDPWANTTEEEFLKAVREVGNLLAAKMSFGPHTPEDIRQQVCVYALEALPRYRPEAGALGAYLYRHCHNRLLNKRRDETGWRTDAPCKTCHLAALGRGAGHEDGAVCEAFARWWARAKAKYAAHQFFRLDPDTDRPERGRESEAEAAAELKDLKDYIARRLPAELRSDFLRLCVGDSVPAARRRLVQDAVTPILREAGLV